MWTNENRARYDRGVLRYPSDLTDAEWAYVEPLIPPARRGGNKRTVNLREVVNGLMYILTAPEVFVSAWGEPLTRWGFPYLLKQHAATAARTHPGLGKKRVSPHVLRHTCPMIVLQATQDIRKVSLWLGHATLTTTEIYTRGDPTEKLDAMKSIVPPHLRRGAFQPSDKLIELLRRSS
jgi:integrase